MKHFFYDNQKHVETAPDKVELHNGMCVYLLGPSNYARFEKYFTKENHFKKDYHRPDGKKETDFPSLDEWMSMLNEFKPDINYFNWTTKQHEFYLLEYTEFNHPSMKYIQLYMFDTDSDIIPQYGENSGIIDLKRFPDTFGIEPNEFNGYLAGYVYQSIGSCDNNQLYKGTIIHE